MSASNPEPEFPEPEDPKERAEIAIGEAGGLPEDNPFTEVAETLRADGESWNDICSSVNELLDVVSEGAIEEDTVLLAEWAITVKVPDPDTPSGYRYRTHERTAETAAEAEAMVEKHTGYEVVEEKTEQVDYGKFS